jgi:hypothetical protein
MNRWEEFSIPRCWRGCQSWEVQIKVISPRRRIPRATVTRTAANTDSPVMNLIRKKYMMKPRVRLKIHANKKDGMGPANKLMVTVKRK